MNKIILTNIGPDMGPMYKETNLDSLIVEPWATFSNIFFLIIVIYWIVKIWKQRSQYKFILSCLFGKGLLNVFCG